MTVRRLMQVQEHSRPAIEVRRSTCTGTRHSHEPGKWQLGWVDVDCRQSSKAPRIRADTHIACNSLSMEQGPDISAPLNTLNLLRSEVS
jgi:hypothetical protein